MVFYHLVSTMPYSRQMFGWALCGLQQYDPCGERCDDLSALLNTHHSAGCLSWGGIFGGVVASGRFIKSGGWGAEQLKLEFYL